MAAPILEVPPQAWSGEEYIIPPGAFGPGFKIVYTDGRNNGTTLQRKRRSGIHTEISHIMGDGAYTPAMFAAGEQGSDATLAEIATFPAANSPWNVPTLLQSLPLDIIGAGSVAGGATGLTHESAKSKGDPGDANTSVWDAGHIALKVALTAWLIRNPLGWPKLDIRFQVCKSPYGPTPELGGLGDHTMWDTCGIQAGGTNPWTLYCKSCPGWSRRGTQRKVQFPTSTITDILLAPGNFRDYFERVGLALAPPPMEEDLTPEEKAMLTKLVAQTQGLYDVVVPDGSWNPSVWEASTAAAATGSVNSAKIDTLAVTLNDLAVAVAALSAKVDGIETGGAGVGTFSGTWSTNTT